VAKDLTIEQIHKSIDKMRALRSQKLHQYSDRIRANLIKLGVTIEILRDDSVMWWYLNPELPSYFRRKRGYSGKQLITHSQSKALVDLFDRVYEWRKPLFLGKMTIPPDFHYKTKEALIDALIGG